MACLACNHRQREALEEDLSKSETPNWRALRHAYGIHHLALMRHKREHMKPAAYRQSISRETSEPQNVRTARVNDVPKPAQLENHHMQRFFEHVEKEAFLSEDAMRRVKHHVHEAAQAWREVDNGRRTPERLQMILEEAFVSDDMGLP